MNFRDILEAKGVKARGYGIIPKLAMLDRELTIEAKAIYSYFCSYAGAGTTAFPSRDKICDDLGISVKRYYKHFSLLKQLGYVEVRQVKKENNKFSYNIYNLIENPKKIEVKANEENPEKESDLGEENKPCGHFDYTEEKKENPCGRFDYTEEKEENPCGRFEHTQIRHTQNDHTISNSSSFISNNVLYNHQSSLGTLDKPKQTDIEDLLEKIYRKIEIEDLKKAYPNDTEFLEEIVFNIMDMYLSSSITIQGERKPQSLIQAAISRLTYFHVETLINKYKQISTSTQITNYKAYIQTMIYNSIFENNLDSINTVGSLV
ncbi:helix-turn-helix protein [Alkalibaculum bacchi]|uniref:Helix-turn-helix protein n=1 Tax=Alkalibaculum bacchi TaxID=645887 RepID=A0A366HZB2_9FIRM|nr:helix-turn-helix domain-containing protein [Alkalibaculum bacchi]RBP59297.1 helix-turn-helix protein [Alkalibaculum bacchi]